ncbi:MAG: hypothetical protein IKR39_07825 [Lachnospiraceae bacterium]|nr:hypothetical protein [Lachnospiraceae bacterium]
MKMKEKNNTKQIFKRIQGLFLAVIITVSLFPAKPVEAATATAKTQVRQELLQMINTVDQSSHNLYQYRITSSELATLFNELKSADDSKWMVAAYYSNLSYKFSTSGKYVKSFALTNVDSDVAARYKRLEANVSAIKAGIEPKMTDLDKIMYLHDSIVELASYKYVAYQSYGVGGVLGDKTGVCSGYTKALNLLLADQGINAIYMSSEAINHGWTAVYLDGQWYHIDSTWDDTRSSKSGLTSRKFLLRNDKEFVTNDKNSHVSWAPWNYSGTFASTSTKYTNWYVHDIVGKMAFEDGYWYYVDTKTNSIMQNTAEGGDAKVILNGSGKSTITLVDATSTGIAYKQDGTTKTVGYEGEKPEVKEATKSEPIVKEAATAVVNEGKTVNVCVLIDGKYITVGQGVIREAKTSRDPAVVVDRIVSLPTMDKWVDSDHYVEWEAITKTASGSKWFLKGFLRER